ncbi:hypothetical protein HG536_0G01040 [Torulaspora globosa]|uniref:Uncharacterized protein n=1 Tax=Torulaspora globosa TaxID=48254 RepID=A0A7G3ZL61_9SACH|nr:uncharacterized protein HG536_0G01040 [Torulaspora globosa]QLL34247.1 hypothetical protein HG536_0G01040 [Torulaspora globosa]
MLLLSKIDADLLQYNKETVPENVINLYLSDENGIDKQNRPNDLHNSHYSKTIELSNNEYIAYHLSNDFSVVSIYTLGTSSGKTINIYLPCPSMNMQHTLNIAEFDERLTISIILKDGVYLVMELPLDFIFSNASHLSQDWLKALNPYDFTIRVPHFLYTISRDFSVIFLSDGGLLGLRRAKNFELEPILFNDNSYIESLVQMFSRKGRDRSEKVISCLLFADQYLLVLTQSCHLKIWDLESLRLISDDNLFPSSHSETYSTGVHECPGNYLSLLNNWLVVYLPFGNGVFVLGQLEFTAGGKPVFSRRNEISSNLSSLSIWTLVDMDLLKPLELDVDTAYLNLVVLWKSGLSSKVQILNIKDENMELYEWIDGSNKSISDIEAEQDLSVNGDAERGLFNLKSRYSPQLYERAQKILSENNIIKLADEEETMDYLANLETLLRDLKNKADEVSSLTVLKDEIIMVNCLQSHNHSVYKVNSALENVYYNIYEEPSDNEQSRYLKTLHGFSATLSPQVVESLSRELTGIVSGEVDTSLTMKEKFTRIFNSCLKSNFEVSNLKLLFDELSTFDIVPLLNDLIENLLGGYADHTSSFIDALAVDDISAVMIMESLYQSVTIQKHFVLEILLTFVLLDFDYDIFSKELNALLNLHYKQSLTLRLYQIDRSLLGTELFSQTTKFRSGVQLHSYSEWNSYLSHALSSIWEDASIHLPNATNRYFMKFFEFYVIQQSENNDRGFTTKLFLQIVGWPYHVRHNQVQEFMLAMMMFACNNYEQAYEYFHLHDYTQSLVTSLPECLEELKDENSASIWSPLIRTLGTPHGHTKFEYELALLFVSHNSPEFGYKCIKKSIEHTMKSVKIEETKDFKCKQLKVYLDLLVHFMLFSEALDVLRCSHDTLSEEIRTSYYRSMLQNASQSRTFFATLLNLCSHAAKGLYLPESDFRIIDRILVSQLEDNDWQSYKRLYSFRILNQHDRSAAEVIYHYMASIASDLETKKKCYLIVINVLSTFDDDSDKWLLDGGKIVTLQELKYEIANL